MKELTRATAESDDGQFTVTIMEHAEDMFDYVDAWVRRKGDPSSLASVQARDYESPRFAPLQRAAAISDLKVVAAKKLVLRLVEIMQKAIS